MTGVRKDLGVRLGVVYRLFYVLTHPFIFLAFFHSAIPDSNYIFECFIGLLYSQESYCNPTSIIVPIFKT